MSRYLLLANLAMPATIFRNIVRKLETEMNNEISISEFYSKSTGMFCQEAASLLALYPSLKVWEAVPSLLPTAVMPLQMVPSDFSFTS
jgi:hypothetical protein